MEPVKHIFGKTECCHLTDAFKGNIAKIVEQQRCKAAQDIGGDQRHCDLRGRCNLACRAGPLHCIDCAAIGKRERQHDALGRDHEQHCQHDAHT